HGRVLGQPRGAADRAADRRPARAPHHARGQVRDRGDGRREADADLGVRAREPAGEAPRPRGEGGWRRARALPGAVEDGGLTLLASFDPETLQEVGTAGEQPRRVLEAPAGTALPLPGPLGLADLGPVDAAEGRMGVVLDPELDALGRGAIGE